MGRHDEAVAAFQRAIKIEPFTEILRVELANVFYHGGKFERAVEQCKEVIDADPKAVWAYEILAANYLRLRRPAEALAAIGKARTVAAVSVPNGPRDGTQGIFPRDPVYDLRAGHPAQEGCALAALGRTEEARLRIAEIQTAFGGDPYSLALLHMALDDKDE